jgi:D-methionine transport system substrate-binding protein
LFHHQKEALFVRKNIKLTAAAAATAALALGLTACGTASDPGAKADSGGKADGSEALVVAASPTPHADILNYVKDNLAKKEGLTLEVKEFTDYVLPNTATQQGQVDANFFQHKPYLDDFNKKNKTTIVPVVNVHLEPLGLYSKNAKDLKDIKAGQTIAVPNDTTNEGRALALLADNGLITLKDGAGTDAKLSDIADAKGLKFKELEAATLPRALNDVDAAVINGNYAIEADLKPAKDSLALEKADGNPYANFLAVKEGNEDDARVQKLAKLLNSPEVKKYIEDKYDGSVVAAFGAAG